MSDEEALPERGLAVVIGMLPDDVVSAGVIRVVVTGLTLELVFAAVVVVVIVFAVVSVVVVVVIVVVVVVCVVVFAAVLVVVFVVLVVGTNAGL